FPTNKCLYQDRQYLHKKTINPYLHPKYTKKQIHNITQKQNQTKNPNHNLPLNPSHNPQTHQHKIPQNSPPYLSNILHHHFYPNTHSKPKNIKTISIHLPI
ncbi:CamS family sex pheromone protein, partial [Staphylococcus epidermidis]|uniref:CamS family sex pheromone protein n=1 Tax=Staphylococcus epidermidis TaxID=1282 RepID=UPI00164318E9